jgi:hypothetical protein
VIRPTVILSTWLCVTGSALAAQPRRTLVIAIDAVPYHTVVELLENPEITYLNELAGPVPLISTFPSATSLALAAILEPIGVENSPGYEAKHYDWTSNKVSGGGLFGYEPFPWRKFFDWKVEGLVRKATSSIRPIKASKKDFRQSLEAFRQSQAPVFYVYYDTTDSAGHLRSPEGLKPMLLELDRQLQALNEELGDGAFRTVLFSDHGMAGGEPLRNVRKGVRKALKSAGFKLRSKLIDERDVVFVPFGLLSSFVVFTYPGIREEAATEIVAVDGLELCVFPDNDGWTIVSGEGRGWFERRQTETLEWRYRTEKADPLGLSTALLESASTGGWLTDRHVFEATVQSRYPDPFYRLSSSFELVHNPASIICSVKDDSMFGSRTTDFGARLTGGRLKWTHGALTREATLGFLMADPEGWKPRGALRFDEALASFVADQGQLESAAR